MKYSPILFSTPMVQAILAGNKTMTRRVVKDKMLQNSKNEYNEEEFLLLTIKSNPYGLVGDVLWVRETFIPGYFKSGKPLFRADNNNIIDSMRNIGRDSGYNWKPSIFMPKQACRLFLKITAVRVERLHDISDDDIIKEGVRIPVSNKTGSNNKVCFELGKENSALSFLPSGCMASNAPKLNQSQLFKAFWAELWCKVNGRKSYDSNPWVWAIELERIEKPENFI